MNRFQDEFNKFVRKVESEHYAMTVKMDNGAVHYMLDAIPVMTELKRLQNILIEANK